MWCIATRVALTRHVRKIGFFPMTFLVGYHSKGSVFLRSVWHDSCLLRIRELSVGVSLEQGVKIWVSNRFMIAFW